MGRKGSSVGRHLSSHCQVRSKWLSNCYAISYQAGPRTSQTTPTPLFSEDRKESLSRESCDDNSGELRDLVRDVLWVAPPDSVLMMKCGAVLLLSCTTTHQAGLFFLRLRLQPGAQRPTPHTTPHHTRPEQNIIHSAQRLRERSECLLRLQRKTSRPLQHWHWQLTGPSSEITGRTTFTFILFKIIIGSISSKKTRTVLRVREIQVASLPLANIGLWWRSNDMRCTTSLYCTVQSHQTTLTTYS